MCVKFSLGEVGVESGAGEQEVQEGRFITNPSTEQVQDHNRSH